ncbi:MAG: 50S ribosomal protein L22 [Candidatus Amesbacteria bacterium GW2011_GWB1_47_26]|uniref:50S ribosomal protein L22 n=1 Tax=Candidatus Amesbacteria bacterium GW2011_GWC2_45_19 TaxID=1618366 RepID=A0A0G1Q329_9BACT|nr:MAG: 50S ribosomal protein L22 [Candidatus Amesbacteria bacterium GW2011_GWC2_45_19]KKU38753.1 MAG: 50S ribosomal protein L22 [Candidatus Amesbacteria bacterium GW2011_GWA1_46_35]KKU69255.1 MAG: 50S ribosomal protein L22 [Microgenomates group bacterium GW2011_GWC1_47_20]KKU75114.1 MAG: 50S ribosomal protein L22 [Candidatus Amesbacteria bacterium GW2011_GWB1_47_26]KKU80411.1 MAG: 50S ribosomal protein L22 [Candidatus Amesbacteria bacterium GW2011_GWA2_47_70]
MIIKAKASSVMTSPRKLRLVANAVRGLSPKVAIDQLRLLPKRAARVLLAVFEQAMGNAKNNFKMSPENLKIKSLQINDGPRGPKRMDRSHGARFDRGVKRRKYAHINLELEEEIHGK